MIVTSSPRSEARASARGRAVPSIRDVAAAAGVSHQTVSRVLNDSPRVSAETRAAVLAAIDRLGFRPNRAARALGLGRAHGVTVVMSDTMLYGYASTLQGIEEAARVEGMAVGVRVVESDGPGDVKQTVDYVSDPSAGAVVVIAFDPAGTAVLEALPPHLPAVAATEPAAPDTGRVALALDERGAAADATRHLLGLGHRTVHHVAIPSEGRSGGRRAGWHDALRGAGAPVPAVIGCGWDVAGAYEAGRRLLADDPEVTAVLCGNDDIAQGVRRALYDAGKDVPGDVSIVGFDDIPGCAYWTPALTTVRMDFAGLGRACLRAAVAELAGRPQPTLTLTPPRLIIRESTAPPR
ncbi:LacI family DNA-binding transcriptional regulator [Nonomuraea roseoviolacea subsp. carminata]